MGPEPVRIRLSVDTGKPLPGEQLNVSVEIVMQRNPSAPPTAALFCVPGGGMTYKFFDLQTETNKSFSFAEAMVNQGFVVVLINSLGVGESSRPNDGYDLTPDVLAVANARAAATILERIRSGGLAFGFPAAPNICAIGVGHSMGGKLTIVQQGQYPLYAGVILFGFGPNGVPDALNDEARSLAFKPDRIRAELQRLTRSVFASAYQNIEPGRSNGRFRSDLADPEGMQALRKVLAPVLAVAGMFSMIPGSTMQESSEIEVPILIVTGDLDFANPLTGVEALFPKAPEIKIYAPAQTGHNLFVFPSRFEVFSRVGDWIAEVGRRQWENERTNVM